MKQQTLLGLTIYALRYSESQSPHIIADACNMVSDSISDYDENSIKQIKDILTWNVNHEFITIERKNIYNKLLLEL